MSWTCHFIALWHAGYKSVHLVADTPNFANKERHPFSKTVCLGQKQFFFDIHGFHLFLTTANRRETLRHCADKSVHLVAHSGTAQIRRMIYDMSF